MCIRDRKSITSILQTKEFDIVQLETLYMTPYIPVIREYTNARIALRSHNVESQIWQNLAIQTSGPKRWYIQHCSSMLQKYELDIRGSYDMLIPITELDAKYFRDRGESAKMRVVSVGLDMENYSVVQTLQKTYRLGFIGSLDWQPNLEGIEWFLNKVWPNIKSVNQDIEFHIAGRNMPNYVKELKLKDVTIYGKVDSAIDFMNSMDLIVVPLFSGSGIRVKILEAMALGKIVLSTSKGYEGIGVTDKFNALIFNSASELIEKLEMISSMDVENMGMNARAHIEKHFSNSALSKNLMDFYAKAIE